MKMKLLFFTIVLSAALFTGCSKTVDVPISNEQKVVNFLTGVGNRYWRLTKISVNTIDQPLTNDQLKFTKTYTINTTQTFAGTFTNSDGYNGKWALNGPINLIEVINNNPAGPVQISYIINEITETKLDIEYTANFKTVREVYFGF